MEAACKLEYRITGKIWQILNTHHTSISACVWLGTPLLPLARAAPKLASLLIVPQPSAGPLSETSLARSSWHLGWREGLGRSELWQDEAGPGPQMAGLRTIQRSAGDRNVLRATRHHKCSGGRLKESEFRK